MSNNSTLNILIGSLILLIISTYSYGYSYSKLGSEPVVDGREAMLIALETNDTGAMLSALNGFKDELSYFKAINNTDLLPLFTRNINDQNHKAIDHLLDRALYEGIASNLKMTRLSQYQISKVLVMKSGLFLNLLTPKLNEQDRNKAKEAMSGLLLAVGSPGVFGVGEKASDLEAFNRHKENLLSSLHQFEK